MATRSFILWKNPNTGRYVGIYCHWDGYPERNGRILLENYNEENIEDLIELGDLSSLADTPEECVAYHRDRGEPLRVSEFSLPTEVLNVYPDVEYIYILENGMWYVFYVNGGRLEFLEDVIDNLEEKTGWEKVEV